MGLQCTNLVRNARMMIIKVVVVQNIIVRFLISLNFLFFGCFWLGLRDRVHVVTSPFCLFE